MAYDFILFRLRRPVTPCPARIPPEFGSDDVVAVDDLAPLHDAIRESALFEPGTVDFGDGGFVWRTPDSGRLDVRATAQGVNIGTHAHWDHVAELFEVSVVVWPDLALFDLHKAQVHDPRSFRDFIDRRHREAEERARHAAADKGSGSEGA